MQSATRNQPCKLLGLLKLRHLRTGDATLRRPSNVFLNMSSLNPPKTFKLPCYPVRVPSAISCIQKLLFLTLELGLKNSNSVSTLHSCIKKTSHKNPYICIQPSMQWSSTCGTHTPGVRVNCLILCVNLLN
jgi:hypothetical protein